MAEGEKGADLAVGAAPCDRKPYVRPELRRLGTVRELTLGTNTGCARDGLKHIKVGM